MIAIRKSEIKTIVQTTSQRAGAALLDRIGPAVLIMHSQAGPFGFLIADARPSLVKAIVSLEPEGSPFQDRVISNSTATTRPYGVTYLPITYSPPVLDLNMDLPQIDVSPAGPGATDCLLQASPPRKLINLVEIPNLVVTRRGELPCWVRLLYGLVSEAGRSADRLSGFTAGGNLWQRTLFLHGKEQPEIAARVEQWLMKVLHPITNVTYPGQL